MTASEKVERLTPTVLPREIWEDRDRDPWFAVAVLGFDTPRTMMVPGEFYDLKGIEDSILSPEELDRRYGPITRVHPPAPAPDTTGGQADSTPEPRLMLGDIWETPADGDWTVTDRYGHLMLSRGDLSERYDFTEQRRGPLRLVQRAGCRRTTKTVTAAQVRPGMVVSRPELLGGAPVRIGSISTRAAGVEVQYELLGDPTVSGAVAGGDALPWPALTLWDEIAGGAR